MPQAVWELAASVDEIKEDRAAYKRKRKTLGGVLRRSLITRIENH
jgi:hypothetical protein